MNHDPSDKSATTLEHLPRDIELYFGAWCSDPQRMPLIVRGARQVGKSHSIESFGRNHFKRVAVVNFERYPLASDCFASRDPRRIVADLEVLLGTPILAGETLLFLDEIQQCPEAILSLRYFKEEFPELHVIAAGSLLEFVLNDLSSFPVGRVQFLTMRPLSFLEFLSAKQERVLRQRLAECTIESPPSEVLHKRLIDELAIYSAVGGMPAAVRAYLNTGSILAAQQCHHDLLMTYRNDFGKYASRARFAQLQRLLEVAPSFVGSHVRYSKIDPEAPNPARDYKVAVQLLAQAGLIAPVLATTASGLPLSAGVKGRKFKLILLDIGLLGSSMGLTNEKLRAPHLMSGALAEQLVGQELLAYADPRRPAELFFWNRDQPSSAAEVDYVIQADGLIVPIEVKAGSTGRLRSLMMFMEEKQSVVGVKVSLDPLRKHQRILSLPIYLLARLRELATC